MLAIFMIIMIMLIDGFVGYVGYILLTTLFTVKSIPVIGIIIKAVVLLYFVFSNTFFPSISGLVLKYRISSMHEKQRYLRIITSNILLWGLIIINTYYGIIGNKLVMLISSLLLSSEIFSVLFGEKKRLSFLILNLKYEKNKLE